MTDLCRKYYVDSINGSDTNDGLSENSAFASLFAINRLALKPGNRIHLPPATEPHWSVLLRSASRL